MARVLVIDDEADALAMMRRILEDQGARVETCLSADGGLDLLGAQVFDALVSDIGMPGEDGYALARQLRAQEQREQPERHEQDQSCTNTWPHAVGNRRADVRVRQG